MATKTSLRSDSIARDDSSMLEDFKLEGMMKKRGQKKQLFTGRRPVQIRLFTLLSEKMTLSYVSKKDTSNVHVIDLREVTKVERKSDDEDGWFLLSVPTRTYEFFTSTTDKKLIKESDTAPLSVDVWMRAIRKCIEIHYSQLSGGIKTVYAQFVDVLETSTGLALREKNHWTEQLLQLSQVSWRLDKGIVAIDLTRVGNIEVRPFASIGISELRFDTAANGVLIFRMSSSEARSWESHIKASQRSKNIIKTGTLEKQHKGKSKWSARQICLTDTYFSYSKVDRNKDPLIVPLEHVTRVSKEKASGSFYMLIPELAEDGNEVFHMRIANADDPAEANRQRDEWISTIKAAVDARKKKIRDHGKEASKISNDDSTTEVCRFTKSQRVQSMTYDSEDNVVPSHKGMLFISKDTARVFFAGQSHNRRSGAMSSVRKISPVASENEIRRLNSAEKRSSTFVSPLRSMSSSGNGMSHAASDADKNDAYLRVESNGEAGEPLSMTFRINATTVNRLAGIFSQIVGTSKQQGAMQDLQSSIQKAISAINAQDDRRGDDLGAALCDFTDLAQKLEAVHDLVGDDLGANIRSCAIRHVYRQRLSGNRLGTGDASKVVEAIRVTMRESGCDDRVLSKHLDRLKRIASTVMSMTEDRLRSAFDHLSEKKHEGVESEAMIRQRFEKLKRKVTKKIVLRVVEAVARGIVRSRTADSDVSKSLPGGIAKIITRLDAVEDARGKFIDIMIADYEKKFCSPSCGAELRSWKARLSYFDLMLKFLYDEDEYENKLFDDEYKVAQIYAKNFVRISRPVLKRLIEEDKRSGSEKDQLSNLISSAQACVHFEKMLDQLFDLDEDSDVLVDLPGDTGYKMFKGQLAQIVSPHLSKYLDKVAEDVAAHIRSIAQDDSKQFRVLNQLFEDKVAIAEMLEQKMDMIMVLDPTSPLKNFMEKIAFTPSSDDTRAPGALHAYADALENRMPGARTKSRKDDIVNDTVFVVYNTAASMACDVRSFGGRVFDGIDEKYQDCDEIDVSGLTLKFESVANVAGHRIAEEIVDEIEDFMDNSNFCAAYKTKDLQKGHIAPATNKLSRHVPKVKESLRQSPRFIVMFVQNLALKMPKMYIAYLEKKVAPLRSYGANQALVDLREWHACLGDLLVSDAGLSSRARKTISDYFKSHSGTRRVETYRKLLKSTFAEYEKVLLIVQGVAKDGYKGLADLILEQYPEDARWLRDDAARMKQEVVDKMKKKMTERVKLVLKLCGITGTRRKRCLYDLEMQNNDDFNQQLNVNVLPLKKPVIRGDGKFEFEVVVDYQGFSYKLLKSEDDFQSLIKCAAGFRSPDVVLPPKGRGMSFFKSKQQREAPHYAKLLQSMATHLAVPQFWAFVECLMVSFKMHVVGRDEDTTNESLRARRRIFVDYRVHVTYNNVCIFPYVPRKKFLKLRERLKRHKEANGISKPTPTLNAVSSGDDEISPQEREDEIEVLQAVANEAILTFGHNHKHIRDFLGKKTVAKLFPSAGGAHKSGG